MVQGLDGKVSVVEAKSARVQLPPEEVLRDKVIAKLDAYSKNRIILEASLGTRFDQVMFSFDVGGQPDLAKFLQGQEKSLSERYGFTVKFLFLETGPAQGRLGRRKKR